MIRMIVAALALACLSLPVSASPVISPAPKSLLERIFAPASVPAAELVRHPAGCPRVAFCGCGASVYLFGRIIPALNRAAEWFKFPRAAPAPRMAAVRRHHVFVLLRPINGDVWLAYDANSGGHRTRVHARSIRGYTIVNPLGSA